VIWYYFLPPSLPSSLPPSLRTWLQALHFSFGVGAVLSPLLLGVLGLKTSFFAFASFGMLPGLATCCFEGLGRGGREGGRQGGKSLMADIESSTGVYQTR